LLHLDSNYRDFREYPYPTEFIVPINKKQTPPCQPVLSPSDIPFYAFQWYGVTDTITGIFVTNNPESPLIQIDPSSIVIDSSDNTIPINNYFTGLMITNLNTGLSSVITSYSYTNQQITLLSPFPSITVGDPFSIVNPSGQNVLSILGDSFLHNLNIAPTNIQISEFYLNSNMIVINNTRGWILPITSYYPIYRMIIFAQNMPSYDVHDSFVIKIGSANSSVLPVQQDSVYSYTIIQNGTGLAVGDVVVFSDVSSNIPARYEVVQTDNNGGAMTMKIVNPGAGFRSGIDLYDTSGNVQIHIDAVENSTGIQTTTETPCLFYIPQLLTFIEQFLGFSIVRGINSVWIFFTKTTIPLGASSVQVNTIYPNFFNNNLNIPVVPYTSVCYQVELLALIIPNRLVWGYDTLLSFFPYLIVEISNYGASFNANNPVYSNNPNMSKGKFVCPIANVKNQLITNFVIVRSPQKISMTINLYQDIVFRILLPNGEPLRLSYLNKNDINQQLQETIVYVSSITSNELSAVFNFSL
jgi:hypothetical protein